VDLPEVLRTGAALVGAGSIVFAARSFRLTKDQAVTTFEDSLAREYREITGLLPPVAFYQNERAFLSDAEKRAVFRYFDLCNEQLRLIDEQRVRPVTAEIWKAGIEELMSRPTFKSCWKELQQGLPAEFFSSLDAFVSEKRQSAYDTQDAHVTS
jgi:hypothetical protein